MPLHLEVAVFSGASGLKAQSLGAHRIELNAPCSYAVGGLTPPVSELTSIASLLEIPVRVMIRPRGPPPGALADFIYADSEMRQMLRAIHDFKASQMMNPLRGDGFVFGVLKRAARPEEEEEEAQEEQGEEQAGRLVIDQDRCRMLVDAARPFGCVFHRAFDALAADGNLWAEGLDALLRCGFTGLLTAGGAGPCCDNAERIDEMRRHVDGRGLQMIAGGGVRSHSVGRVVAGLDVHGAGNVWMHSAALTPSPPGETGQPGASREELDADELLGLLGAMRRAGGDQKSPAVMT